MYGHILQVLKASKNKPNDSNVQNEIQKTSTNNKGNSIDEPPSKKQRILEKITYDDLEDNDSNQKSVGQQLNLSKVLPT